MAGWSSCVAEHSSDSRLERALGPVVSSFAGRASPRSCVRSPSVPIICNYKDAQASVRGLLWSN